MAGYLRGTDSTFLNPSTQASATYGIGANGEIHQYVSETDTAWTDSNAYSNGSGISIEHEGGIQAARFTQACADSSAALCADIARRYGLGRLWHDGTNGNVWLHREIPGSDHTTCPDLAPNGVNVDYIINKANEINGTGEEMALKDEIINYGGGQFSAAYAIEDLRNNFDKLFETLKTMPEQILYYSESGNIEDTPIYQARANGHNLEKISEQIERMNELLEKLANK